MTRYALIAAAGVVAGSIGACNPSPMPSTIPGVAGDVASVPDQTAVDGAPTASMEPARTSPSAASPTAPRPTVSDPSSDADRVSLGGVSVVVPATLAKHVAATEIDAIESGPDTAPAHVRFVLEGYPLARTDAPATLEVFRGPLDPTTPSTVMSTYRQMYRMLTSQDAHPSHVYSMPRPNERQLFRSRERYIGLGLGTGEAIQFVGMIGGTPRPVNNAELMYVAQGLMRAQGSWVSFKAPVSVDDPGIAADATIADPAAFTADFGRYIRSTTALLNGLPASAFTPDLDELESVVKSVTVDWTAPSADSIATGESIPLYQPTTGP